MRVHHYEGDGFCTVPLDGVPCLHARSDPCHVQPYRGKPSMKTALGQSDAMSHRLRVATMRGQPVRYLVMIDFNAYRRYCIAQHTSLERCQMDIDDPIWNVQGRMWVEDLKEVR